MAAPRVKRPNCPDNCAVHPPTPTRMVVWSGPSELTGEPIVVLATGVPATPGGRERSSNAKTGDAIQVFILRSDVSPLEAKRQGLDVAICGVCPHKSKAAGGSNACYVNVGQGPERTWQSHRAHGSTPFDIERLRGRKVRFGAYGDPAAVPFHVWSDIAAVTDHMVLGYTHQWRSAPVEFATLCMASADSVEDRRDARALGYRTFRVRTRDQARLPGETVCPASAEAGKRTVCATCMSCGGTGNGRRNDVVIIAHGSTARSFRPLPLSVVN